MAYRMTPAMRSTDFSPYFLVFGYDMLTPLDTEIMPPENVPKTYAQHLKNTIENLRLAWSLAKENVQHNIDRNREAHDTDAKEPNFKVCQTVLLYTPQVQKGLSSKLQRKWKGPYYIVECCRNHTYSLRHADTHVLQKTLVHANRLKPFTESSTPQGVESVEDSGQTDLPTCHKQSKLATASLMKLLVRTQVVASQTTHRVGTLNIPLRRYTVQNGTVASCGTG